MSDLLEKIQSVAARALALEEQLGSPEVASNPGEYARVAKEHAALRPAAVAAEAYGKVLREIEDAKAMLEESDTEMRELAESELTSLEPRREELEQEIRLLLLPTDPNDEKNAILELRAGTGGEEAALFASDLFRMYNRYRRESAAGGSRSSRISQTPSAGGLKEVIATFSGRRGVSAGSSTRAECTACSAFR